MDIVLAIIAEHLVDALLKTGNEILDFRTEFEAMNSHLNHLQGDLTDAENLKRYRNNDQSLKSTIKELRDLIYDADDLLIDCQIRGNYQKSFLFCYRPLPLDHLQTVKKLKKINWKIEGMRKVWKRSDRQNDVRRENRWTSQAINQDKIVGLEEDTKKIKEWIFAKSEELKRIGILGMPGLGKTTIAQKIFNDLEVKNSFHKLIWVCVTQSSKETNIIMKSMLKQIDEGNVSECDSGDLLHKIQEKLSDKKYLIVFDDVWIESINDGWWDRMSTGLPKGAGDCSSIIITTRDEDVAKGMAVGRIHRPQPLDLTEGWLLLCNFAFSSSERKNEVMDSSIEKEGKDIVKKCDGLPLAIKTAGGILSAKSDSLSEWKRINREFNREIAKAGKNKSTTVLPSLQVSYDDLPRYLKSCLLCFSFYPNDDPIIAEKLVYWWIGEGFVPRKKRTLIESGFDCLSDLISRGLVQVVSRRGHDGRVYTCKLHTMVRDFCIHTAKEEEFGSFDDNNMQKPNPLTRHLSITSEKEMDRQVLEGKSKLRAFLFMINSSFDFKTRGLAQVKSLRVLDLSHNCKLEGISSVKKLLAWISSQKRLAYLNLGLQGVAGLKKLPNSIKMLRNLEILVLTECSDLEKLPGFIRSLRKLTILDIGNCPSLHYLPHGLHKLSNLEFLSGFKLASPSKSNACRVSDLVELTQLRVLRIEIIDEDDDELADLSKLEKLQVLSICTKNCKKQGILDKLSPPRALEQLYLIDYPRESMPNWINPEVLCELLYLHIENADDLKEISDSFFKSEKKWTIEGLCFKSLKTLVLNWKDLEDAMPLFKHLELRKCPMFQSFPCDVNDHVFWKKNTY